MMASSVGKDITNGGKTKEEVPKVWEMDLELRIGAKGRILNF